MHETKPQPGLTYTGQHDEDRVFECHPAQAYHVPNAPALRTSTDPAGTTSLEIPNGTQLD